MNSIHVKACPKCGGDLYKQADMFGPYVSCFQCGHYLSELEEVALSAGALEFAKAAAEPAALEPVAA